MTIADATTTVLPGDGWFATYRHDDDHISFEPVICWVVTVTGRSIPRVEAMVADDHRKPQRATKWNNLTGYVRR